MSKVQVAQDVLPPFSAYTITGTQGGWWTNIVKMQVTLMNMSGALQIAISISIFLFGIVTMQTHQYYHTFQNDCLIFKFLLCIFLTFLSTIYSFPTKVVLLW